MVIRASPPEPASEGSAATSSGGPPPEVSKNPAGGSVRGAAPPEPLPLPLTRVGDRHATKPGPRWARVRSRGPTTPAAGPRPAQRPAARGAGRGAAPGAPAERPGPGAGREDTRPAGGGGPAADPAGAARAAPPGMAGDCRALGVAPRPAAARGGDRGGSGVQPPRPGRSAAAERTSRAGGRARRAG